MTDKVIDLINADKSYTEEGQLILSVRERMYGGHVFYAGDKVRWRDIDYTVIQVLGALRPGLVFGSIGLMVVPKKPELGGQKFASKNGPPGTKFALWDTELDQRQTLIVSHSILPACKVLQAGPNVVYMPVDGGKSFSLAPGFVGINGDLEAAKKCVCEMLDNLWAASDIAISEKEKE